jgi:hypothetical protein
MLPQVLDKSEKLLMAGKDPERREEKAFERKPLIEK